MFRILIVDDDVKKIEKIIERLSILIEASKIVVEYELEVKKACESLENQYYDLLILDVQLPSLGTKTTVSKNGGVDILNIINSLKRIIKPGFIIGLTAHDENYEDVASEFQNKLWSLLKYSEAEMGWIEKIEEKVMYLCESKGNSIKSVEKSYSIDCAIVTAVEVELNSVLKHKFRWKENKFDDDPTTYYEGIVNTSDGEKKIVVAKQNQMGMVASATLTTKLISNYNPLLVCMLGISAGREGEVNLGDIIVANESWDYGSGKIKSDDTGRYQLQPEPHQLSIAPAINDFFQKNFTSMLYQIRCDWNNGNGPNMDKDIKIKVGPLASGAAVIQSEEVITEFIQPHNRKVLGLDMETYAVYYSCINTKQNSPKFLSIKAVCDFANQYKNDKFQDYAAYNSSEIFFRNFSEIIKLV